MFMYVVGYISILNALSNYCLVLFPVLNIFSYRNLCLRGVPHGKTECLLYLHALVWTACEQFPKTDS